MENRIKKNDVLKLNIEDLTLEGVGIGRYNQMAVFVGQTAVGDLVQTKIIKVKPSYLVGKLEKVIVPSASRIKPDCAVSQKCGGCAFRHIRYEEELKIKQKHVKDCLERIGGFKDIIVEPIIGAKNIFNYRNKVQMPFGYNSNGEIIAGFYANHSHRIVDCPKCLLHPKIFDEIIGFIKKFILKYNISAYNELSKKGILRHVYLRSAEKCNQIMVCLVLNGENMPYIDDFAKSITAKFKNIKSIFINVNRKDTNVIFGEKFIKIFGEDCISETLCGKKFKISPNSFYQVNHDQTEVLYSLAKEVLNPQKDENILDLYCGVGTIGLNMAENARSLCGVEILESAVNNARENANINGISNAKFFLGDSSDVIRKNLINSNKKYTVIVDPPRKGCSDDMIEDILKIMPKKLLYISCNPATLAKNLKEICSRGAYDISRIIPVDMFPRTGHVETVVLISKDE